MICNAYHKMSQILNDKKTLIKNPFLGCRPFWKNVLNRIVNKFLCISILNSSNNTLTNLKIIMSKQTYIYKQIYRFQNDRPPRNGLFIRHNKLPMIEYVMEFINSRCILQHTINLFYNWYNTKSIYFVDFVEIYFTIM